MTVGWEIQASKGDFFHLAWAGESQTSGPGTATSRTSIFPVTAAEMRVQGVALRYLGMPRWGGRFVPQRGNIR
jgi:hypothetical protein